MTALRPGERGAGREKRALFSRALALAGGLGLIASLFLTWSHQLSAAYANAFAGTGALAGLPRDATAWQVYSILDGLLALLAVGFCVAGLTGRRGIRRLSLAAWGVAVAFVIHALAVPPTNGVTPATAPGANSPGAGVPADQPAAGVGETVALAALTLAGAGLALSFTVPSAASRRARPVPIEAPGSTAG